MELYEVGGCVRDELLGVKSKDIDFTVVMEPADIAAYSAHNQFTPFEYMVFYLENLGFKIFLETPEFFTVRAQFPGEDIQVFNTVRGVGTSGRSVRKSLTADFVLARKESDYTDGRRPDKVEPGTLEDDLARRDFTMNAIAKDADGSLIDPFNGVQDIKRRRIAAVGDPADRLAEDALRAVRAFRFAVTKNFSIDTNLADVMNSYDVCQALIDNISEERIQQELSKAFRFNSRRAGTILFRDFPLLANACFSGTVSLDATMKTKGRGR